MLFFLCLYVHSRINIISLRSQHVPRKLCSIRKEEMNIPADAEEKRRKSSVKVDVVFGCVVFGAGK
jgi:hypothetical protein